VSGERAVLVPPQRRHGISQPKARTDQCSHEKESNSIDDHAMTIIVAFRTAFEFLQVVNGRRLCAPRLSPEAHHASVVVGRGGLIAGHEPLLARQPPVFDSGGRYDNSNVNCLAMSSPHRSTRLIALIAAYVVALQALLLPLAVVAGGVTNFGLCSAGASAADTQSPAGDQSGCPCAAGCGMQCCGHLLAGPPQGVFTTKLLPVGSDNLLSARNPVIRHVAAQTTHFARGPPGA
jgi:hypothetical protein